MITQTGKYLEKQSCGHTENRADKIRACNEDRRINLTKRLSSRSLRTRARRYQTYLQHSLSPFQAVVTALIETQDAFLGIGSIELKTWLWNFDVAVSISR